MMLLSRLRRLERLLPNHRGRQIREIIESIVAPAPVFGDPPVVVQVNIEVVEKFRTHH